MLTCHVTLLKFVEDLWEEVKTNIQEFKLQHSGQVDPEVSQWLMAIDYMIPKVDAFIKYELPDHMDPIPSWMIALMREVKQLFQIWIEDANVSQYACKPTPGEWSEWSGKGYDFFYSYHCILTHVNFSRTDLTMVFKSIFMGQHTCKSIVN